MSQPGIRSFFSKKNSASKDDQKGKKQLQTKKQQEEVSKVIPPAVISPSNKIRLSEEGSPVFKQQRKRSRVLADSDTEEEEPEKENSSQTSVDESKETNGRPSEEEKTPLCPNGTSEAAERSGVRRELVLSPVKSASPAASLSSSPLLKTPPKRQTARKHTGPITIRAPRPTSKKPRLASTETTSADTPSSPTPPSTGEEEKNTDEKEKKNTAEEEMETEKEKIEKDKEIDHKDDKIENTNEKDTRVEEKEIVEDSPMDTDAVAEKEENVKPTVSESPKPKKTPAMFGASKKGKQKEQKGSCTDGYYPNKTDYHPVEDACWEREKPVPYLAVARTFEHIENESGRLKIVSILTNFLRSVIALTPSHTLQCVYLCLNKIAPAYKGLELGVGEGTLIKALSSATGRTTQHIKAEAAEKGDLGLIAESSRSTQRMMFAPPKLTVPDVFDRLKEIAAMSGTASTNKKVETIKKLLVACRHSEARYLIRSLGGKLRIGLAEQSVLTALAHAMVYTPPSRDGEPVVVDASKNMKSDKFQKELEDAVAAVKSAYCELPSYDILVPALLSHSTSELHKHCYLTPGIPLKPMLAHPTKGLPEVMKRFDQAEFTCEWKYDGERAQIHVLEGGEVHVYSRNSEDNTTKYPDIIARMPRALKEGVVSCVIDAEAVAWDTEQQQILPFQILSTRKRKDADMSNIKVQVCVFAFDLLFFNGQSLVREPLRKRRDLLRSSFNEVEGEFMFAKSIDSTQLEDIQEFMDESVKGNCEGLMVKTLEKEATYDIARRSHNWLKLKKDYLEGVGDTLDLVPIGAFFGTGKRTGKYGGFLLACYNDDSEEFEVICKIGTGFKDDDLDQHYSYLKERIISVPKPYYRWSESVTPDHWFDSSQLQVWEIKAADLSISPVYPAAAGIVDPEKGISLRFPRFLRVRDDKKPEDATTSTQVAELYNKQQNKTTGRTTSSTANNDDFY